MHYFQYYLGWCGYYCRLNLTLFTVNPSATDYVSSA
jgi:hypothetical protein